MRSSHATSRGALRLPILCVLALTLVQPAPALTPPPAGGIAAYRQDGTFEKRRAFAEKLGNHLISPALLKNKLAGLSGGATLQALPYKPGLASKGTQRVLVFAVDFPDYPAKLNTPTMSSRLFSTTITENQPYESMAKYYQRSSYNQLTITGEVMARHRAAHNRSYYTDNAGTLIAELFNAYNYSKDFSVYDNDGDGKIDYFIIFWTGKDEGWGSFWWSWNNSINDPTWKVDGKTLGNFSWIAEDNCLTDYGYDMDPRTAIHETGHALGLPDYYDYDDKVGPKGGLGGLDMMDNGWHDHNAFSKWLLDWIAPTVVGGTGTLYKYPQMRPSSLYADAVAIMPGMTATNPFAEFYLVQNRVRGSKTTSNDYTLPGDGVIVWHVDARLNSTGNGFKYDNSYTDHKLLKPMEADGGDHIEKNMGFATADYYAPGSYLSPVSTPTSANYAGARTGVTVFNIAPVTFSWPPVAAGTCGVQFMNAGSSTNWIGVGEAVDNNNLVWATGGSSSALTWFGQKSIYKIGGDAAQCSSPGNSQYVNLDTRLTGPGPLTFQWKVSSESGKDWLEFWLDGVRQDRISGSTNFAQKAYNLTAGSHTIRWKYVKDAAGAAGYDCAWVDAVDYSYVPFAVAVDNNSTTWTQSGSMQWFGEDKEYTFGGSAARSGPVADGQDSTFKTTVAGPGWVDFAWKVSSQSGDILRLRKNGVNIANISGEVDWTTKTLYLDSGYNTIEWAYIKNSSGAAGQDCGWVDHIRFSSPSINRRTLAQGVDNSVLAWTSIPYNAWRYVSSPNHDGADAAACSLSVKGQTATLRTVVTGPGTLTYWYKDDPANSSGWLDVFIDGKYAGSGTDTSWNQKSLAIAEGLHVVDWVYTLEGDNVDTFAIDQVEYTPANLDLVEALDNPQIKWETWGNPNGWSAVQMENAFGMDAARSGAITHDYNTFLEGTVNGPALLSFNWKVSSQAKIGDSFDHDDLEFYLDDKQVGEINGEVGWRTEQYLLPKGSHKIMWDYYKDEAISAGQDCGWVDRVRVDPLPSLAEAVDNPAMNIWCAGSADWLGQPLLSYYGGSAARSGAIVTGQKSIMATTVTGPARLGWHWKISAAYSNRLELWIDNKFQIQVTGSANWTAQTYYIQPGAHVVEWRYNKISPFADGQDCAWVDKVTVTSVPKTVTDGGWILYR